jgi:hypothetical protein
MAETSARGAGAIRIVVQAAQLNIHTGTSGQRLKGSSSRVLRVIALQSLLADLVNMEDSSSQGMPRVQNFVLLGSEGVPPSCCSMRSTAWRPRA